MPGTVAKIIISFSCEFVFLNIKNIIILIFFKISHKKYNCRNNSVDRKNLTVRIIHNALILSRHSKFSL